MSDTSTTNTSGSIFSYIYQSLYPIKSTENLTQEQAPKDIQSFTVQKEEKIDAKSHEPTPDTMDSLTVPHIINTIKSEIERIKPEIERIKPDIERVKTEVYRAKAFTEETLAHLGTLTNEVQETCAPYMTPVKRLGNIASQAIHSEATDKVKENVQLTILNGIETTLRTARLSFEAFKNGQELDQPSKEIMNVNEPPTVQGKEEVLLKILDSIEETLRSARSVFQTYKNGGNLGDNRVALGDKTDIGVGGLDEQERGRVSSNKDLGLRNEKYFTDKKKGKIESGDTNS